MAGKLKAISPGEVLLEEFLKPMSISQYELAKSIGVPQTRISQIVKGKRALTSDSALRFAQFFGTTAEFWMNMQINYDLQLARTLLEKKLKKEITPFSHRSFA